MLKIYSFFVSFLLLLFMQASPAQEFLAVHPYRQFDIGPSTSDGYAVNGEIIYLATLFDGHIYTFNVKTRELKDRFRIHPENKNQNSPGGMIYIEKSKRLYAGTGKSFTSVPQIYIFDTTKDTLPEKILTIDTLGIYSFFSPIQVGNYLYWGCYHTQPGGFPKIIKIDLSDHSWEVKECNVSDNGIRANYTYTVRRWRNLLYVSTENGHILKYNLKSNAFIEHTIDLTSFGAAYIQHLTPDGEGLWALTPLATQPLFYIENPAQKNPKIHRVPSDMRVIFSRIFLGKSDGYLYGQGYRIKFLRGGRFDYQPLEYLNYENLRDIIGAFTLDGKQYLIAENTHLKDVEVTQREFRTVSLPPAAKPEPIIIPDIKSENSGAILLTLGSDYTQNLYMSTYLIGFMYAVNQDFRSAAQFLTDNNGVRFNEQADIITAYPGAAGSMLFGCYRGSSGSAVLYYYHPARARGEQWSAKSLPMIDRISYPRLTALAFDSLDNLYAGTGEMTISANTPPAAIFYMPREILQNGLKSEFDQEIKYHWPADDVVGQPLRFVAMLHDRDYLYCISYHAHPQGITNRFFRVNLKTGDVEISNAHNAGFAGIRNRLLLREGRKLLVGFGAKLYQYDLDNFNFNAPLKEADFSAIPEFVKGVVGDGSRYYVCLDHKIAVLNQQLELIRYIDTPAESDLFNAIDMLGSHLFAITKNGLLMKYDLNNF